MVVLVDNEYEVNEYLELRDMVNWPKLSYQQAEVALKNSLFVTFAYQEDELIGMGRIIGDGAVVCYVQDLIVVPNRQTEGLGSRILTHLIDYVKSIGIEDTTLMLDLMCRKGREEFYEKHGFVARPTEELGPGMIRYLTF